MSGLDTAQLSIYCVLAMPVLYLAFRHGSQGILGWGYLFAFCSLRIVGGALALSNGSKDQASAIISNIGLSPLLLAMSGILHEARYYRNSRLQAKLEWILILIYHLIVTTGLALVASGSAAFKVNNTDASKGKLAKTGIVILLLAWVIICVWTLASFLRSQYTRDAAAFSDGSKLLCAILFSLPFVGVRTLHSVISILSPTKQLNPVNGALGFRLGLSFLMELIVTMGFILAGAATQGVRRKVKGSAHLKVRSPRRGQNRGGARESDVGLSEI